MLASGVVWNGSTKEQEFTRSLIDQPLQILQKDHPARGVTTDAV